MRRRGPQQELRVLKRFMVSIEGQFLSRHLPSTSLGTPTESEVLDVAAYVVLAHGAFENFVEGVGLWALERLEHSWTRRRRASRCTASLLLYQPPPSYDTYSHASVYDTLRTALANAKSSASRLIEQNHG